MSYPQYEAPVYTVTATDEGFALLEDDIVIARVSLQDGRYAITMPVVLASDQAGWSTPDFSLRHAASYCRVTALELRLAINAIYAYFYRGTPE